MSDNLRHTQLDNPIIISVVLKATDQIVEAYLEDVKVTEVFQRGLSNYSYNANWEMGKYNCLLQAHTDKFVDDPEELQKLEWVIANGWVIPKLFNRYWIER